MRIADDELGIRPFNARSLVLSVLLGRDPPALPARALVALGELFGIASGTMRTALSRLVAAGELTADDGEYRLVGRLLERKTAQDIGRQPAPGRWDGAWWVAVVTAERRSVGERRAFRTAMANHRMGELRPDIWLRPANLPGPAITPGTAAVAAVRGPLTGIAPTEMVGRLWPLPAVAARADALLSRVEAALPELERGRPSALPATIALSAAVVRFLRAEPLLPPELTPQPWPVDALRTRYRTFDRAFGRVLATATTAARD